ncbi:uncharacterized protein Dana_GF22755, isoform A [Drosophila ananassae]|uniref:Uncharacterized protein, isoform A n=2 Tax=Drosophila ananassae TaxID=7217 RepID=B3N020_DROAN|nr:RNA polymerase I-specific transcription initiation factor RRN3 isoform X1 [Drosophila ananassae]EDV35386.1 uncharacterized protein Dana_GF22755, isoform A [Drosophila ananassae]
MSVYPTKTSILKTFSGADRERAKVMAANKVRFSTPKEKGLAESVRVASEEQNFHLVHEFTYFLREAELDDDELEEILKEARKIVHNLTPDFVNVVEALLSLNWRKRSCKTIEAFTEFSIEILVAHNRYLPMGISKFILHWIPNDQDAADWVNGCPSNQIYCELKPIHDVINRIITAVPMAFDVIVDTISSKFPYFKKPAHVTAGYLFNLLWLLDYKPVFEEIILQLVLQKLLILDVNAPRDEIDLENHGEEKQMEDPLFQIDEIAALTDANKSEELVDHPIGQSLDICLHMLYKFFDKKCNIKPNCTDQQRCAANRIFNILLFTFDEILLPSHNTHHVQFVIFFITSLRQTYSEAFLSSLWQKVQNPNVSAIIRHGAIGYLASFLARAKFVPLCTLTLYLMELSKWAHSYIDDSDEYSQNCSLKSNLVFFSVCQAIFYLIAFRVRDLTATTKDLLFLQSLQLSRLAMCHFNPLRYCLAAIATAFAGVTRTYQLAYCHTVLERNARRKLATVYGHEKCMPEETLETFFPFDPYMLKMSNKYIEINYLIYQGNTDDNATPEPLRRKRGDSEMVEDDDFIKIDKRQKLLELSKSQELEKDFNYGSSSGFSK